jgi:hypothetical protein
MKLLSLTAISVLGAEHEPLWRSKGRRCLRPNHVPTPNDAEPLPTFVGVYTCLRQRTQSNFRSEIGSNYCRVASDDSRE